LKAFITHVIPSGLLCIVILVAGYAVCDVNEKLACFALTVSMASYIRYHNDSVYSGAVGCFVLG